MPLKSEREESLILIISVVSRYLSTFYYKEGGPFIFLQVFPFLTVVANKKCNIKIVINLIDI